MRESIKDVEGISFLSCKSKTFLWFSRIILFLQHHSVKNVLSQVPGTPEGKARSFWGARGIGRKI